MDKIELERRYRLWTQGYWEVPEGLDVNDFDFDWRPDSNDRPYIHQFGTQWQRTGGPRFVVPENEGIKFRNEQTAKKLPNKDRFNVLVDYDVQFDWSWHPDELEPPFIWVFGNQFFDSYIMPTIEYHVDDAIDRKYAHDRIATLISFNTALSIIPRYVIKSTLETLIAEHENEVFWALNPDINYDKFDFDWKPDETNFRHINAFGNDLSKDTKTYFINGPQYKLGSKAINYIENVSIDITSNLSMFWIDTGINDNSDQFEKLKIRYPEIQKTRYINTWVDTITRCIKKAKTKLVWILSSDIDYTNFEFDFYPAPWQMNLVHVFGTQWSHWGPTYLINTETFPEDTKYIKVLEHLPKINHIRAKRAPIIGCQHDILYIDHGFSNEDTLTYLLSLGRKVHQVTYDSSYLKTIKQWINDQKYISDTKSIWITSSICNYDTFDFSWHPDPFQLEQLHVFSSEYNGVRQKFGDTFLLNISAFSQHIDEIYDLQKYEKKVNYIEHITAKRQSHPVIMHDHDSQIDAIKSIKDDTWPYYELVDTNNCMHRTNSPVISLWDQARSSILVASAGASHLMIPKSSIPIVKKEVYDYPWIDNAKRVQKSKPLDIVFISNGEPIAESNYEHLLEVAKKSKITNRITRVSDVKGRVASQHAAANASLTNWYFLVNGKIKVDPSFDWNWQPDRLQQPKHYIFNVTNPVNGLIYGHQAIVANNKKLTLATEMKGLDFTLDSLHEVVDINCGVALYNTDPWTTWRTAFRECIKLSCNEDDISKDRLSTWLSIGSGENEEWSRCGVQDAIEYYNKCKGKLDKLLLTYDWEWLQKLYAKKYGNVK